MDNLYYAIRRARARLATLMPSVGGLEGFMERMRVEDACRETLKTAHDLMVDYGWSKYDAYIYARDLLHGIWLGLRAVRAYSELRIVSYYREVACHRIYER